MKISRITFLTVLLALHLLVFTHAVPVGNGCSLCPPGFGVSVPCTGSTDTQCVQCPPGHYSNVSSATDRCLVCSQCGEELFELKPCSGTADVFCELCSWTKATDNPNYLAKCRVSYSVKKEENAFRDINEMLGDQPVDTREIAQSVSEGQEAKFKPEKTNKTETHPKTPDLNVTFNATLEVENVEDPEDMAALLDPNVTTPDLTTPKNVEMKNSTKGENTTEIGDTGRSVVVGSSDSENATRGQEPDKLYDGDTGDDLSSNKTLVYPMKHNITNVDTHPMDSNSLGDLDSNDSMIVGGVDNSSDLGSGDVGVVVGVDVEDTEPPEQDPSTTVSYVQRRTTTRQWTWPPVIDEQTPTEEEPVIAPVHVPDADSGTPEDEVGALNVAESKEEEAPVFAILMAVLTTGFIFFVLGFMFNKRRSGTVTYSPSHKTKNRGMNNNYHEMKALNSTSPNAHIIYSSEDEREWGAPPFMREPQTKHLEADVPSESTPMLPNDDTFPLGNEQSPVNIDCDSAEVDATLEKQPLIVRYIAQNVSTITNTGATLSVNYDCRESTLTGGPLGSKRFCLDHIEMRWGALDSRGSEHTVNGVGYAAEIQLVHWNHDDFESFAQSVGSEDGVAVLSVFAKVGEANHKGLKLITDCVPSIQYKSESRHFPGEEFDAETLLPDNTCDYWTYNGSLTSPPYQQNVTWIVFKDHICVSHDQLEQLRRLRCLQRDEDDNQQPHGGFVVDNYRYTMPLGDRKITASFI